MLRNLWHRLWHVVTATCMHWSWAQICDHKLSFCFIRQWLGYWRSFHTSPLFYVVCMQICFFANMSVSPLSQSEATWQWQLQHWCCIDQPRQEAACTGLRSTLQYWCYTDACRLRVNVELACLCLKTESGPAVSKKYLRMMIFKPNILLRQITDMTPSLEYPVSRCLKAQLVLQCQCLSCAPALLELLQALFCSPCWLGCVGPCWERDRWSWAEMVSLHARNSWNHQLPMLFLIQHAVSLLTFHRWNGNQNL